MADAAPARGRGFGRGGGKEGGRGGSRGRGKLLQQRFFFFHICWVIT